MSKAQWFNGQSPSSADNEAFNAFKTPPNVQTHPNTFTWYTLLTQFSSDVKTGWPTSAPDQEIINNLRSGVSSKKPTASKAAPPAGSSTVVASGPPRNVGEMTEVLANIERMHFLLKKLKVDEGLHSV